MNAIPLKIEERIKYPKIAPIGSANPDKNEYKNAFLRLPVHLM
jgi:hypothetical protein